MFLTVTLKHLSTLTLDFWKVWSSTGLTVNNSSKLNKKNTVSFSFRESQEIHLALLWSQILRALDCSVDKAYNTIAPPEIRTISQFSFALRIDLLFQISLSITSNLVNKRWYTRRQRRSTTPYMKKGYHYKALIPDCIDFQSSSHQVAIYFF